MSVHSLLAAAIRPRRLVDVAVAVVQRADGRVLLAERPAHKVSGGYWEFPGGKFDAGERAEQALARELEEEVGIVLERAQPWMIYEYDYPDKRVRLHFFRVTAWRGIPHGREGQRLSWEDPLAPKVSPLLPANDKALRALALPKLYAITNASRYGVVEFLDRLERALAHGLRMIQVREREMAPGQLAQFARRVVERARPYGAIVLVNANELMARQAGADGVHSNAAQLWRLNTRPAVRLWGASCHNAEELARAAELGADFVVISPVLPTASHPGEPVLGWAGFAALARQSPLPVYALGGMKLELQEEAERHGAHGIAVQSHIW